VVRRGIVAGAAMAMVLVTALAGPAAAQSMQPRTYEGQLLPMNDSGVTADARLTVEADGQLTVMIDPEGLAEGLPHAQHIHGLFGDQSVCPPQDADTDVDRYVSHAEGVPFYGNILQTLTTTGDTTTESALAVDRFPTGNDVYQRTFPVAEGLADNLGLFHIVLHGVDIDGSGMYDGDKPSELDPSLPFEATVPAACGTLALMPTGGVATGAGGTADTGAPVAAAAAMAVVAGGGALLALRRRGAA
jgi:hypothetical protein